MKTNDIWNFSDIWSMISRSETKHNEYPKIELSGFICFSKISRLVSIFASTILVLTGCGAVENITPSSTVSLSSASSETDATRTTGEDKKNSQTDQSQAPVGRFITDDGILQGSIPKDWQIGDPSDSVVATLEATNKQALITFVYVARPGISDADFWIDRVESQYKNAKFTKTKSVKVLDEFLDTWKVENTKNHGISDSNTGDIPKAETLITPVFIDGAIIEVVLKTSTEYSKDSMDIYYDVLQSLELVDKTYDKSNTDVPKDDLIDHIDEDGEAE